MKIFVCEFITGGGLYREPLPASLAREGLLMRDALLRDLAGLPDIEVSTTCDTRMPAPQSAAQTRAVEVDEDIWRIWDTLISQADAVWLIAPETDGMLLRLTMIAEGHGKMVIGCPASAVRIAASKYATCQVLQSAGIRAVSTYRLADWPQHQARQWVAKPDDGAGCSDSAYFADIATFKQWLRGRETTHVIQPWQSGVAASLCVLCKQGRAWLLSCNLQNIVLQAGSFHYTGSVLNGAAEHWQACAALAVRIAQAIPQLSAYVGIDILIDDDAIHVLEINPRLTTSYVGLNEALACNPARLMLDLLYNEHFQLPQELSRNVVEIKLNDAA